MRELQQRATEAQKDADFIALNFWTGTSTGREEKRRQIDGNGAKRASVAAVDVRRIRGRGLLNKNGQNSEAIY